MARSRFLAATALLLLASGCTRIALNEGFVADPQLLSAIQPGVDTRQSVQRTLGRPTLTGQFDDREFYYISRNSNQLAFLRPLPSAQNILIITFDDKDVVKTVSRRGLEYVANIAPNKDKTPTLGRETGLIDDLFGNIGQFGAAAGGAGDGGGGGGGRDGPRQ
jgi:outer membrane protein assembly factor BamE (lipoprotein component of BamABCDE complex)